MRRRLILAAFAAAILASAFAPAHAEQTFPAKPVHIFVPYPPGGGVDIVARTLGDALSKTWHQSVIVENHPGAGGTIASEMLVKSPADGYTLIVVASGHPINPYLYARLPYDTFKDFTPIALLASSPNIMLVRADSLFKTVADVIAAAKAKPNALSYGMAGNGTSTHLAGELLKYMAKVNITPIPYKGGAPVINDLLGGHIPMSFNNAPESLSQVKAGALRALGVTTGKRSPLLPDVPSIAETLPGYDTQVWWGLLGPGGMPKEITAKLNHDFLAALKVPSVREHLQGVGALPAGDTPEDFDALIHADYKKWGPIIHAAGIKPE
jgi:tripartite-type tricarboxylate transporter receptor subunit TctC